MGLFKRSQINVHPVSTAATATPSTSATRDDPEKKRKRKKSIFNLIPKTRVSEATLEVWRNLPGEIRQDPSMINFQREAERWQGNWFHSQLVFCELICDTTQSMFNVRMNSDLIR
jgi:hypothetical protein